MHHVQHLLGNFLLYRTFHMLGFGVCLFLFAGLWLLGRGRK